MLDWAFAFDYKTQCERLDPFRKGGYSVRHTRESIRSSIRVVRGIGTFGGPWGSRCIHRGHRDLPFGKAGTVGNLTVEGKQELTFSAKEGSLGIPDGNTRIFTEMGSARKWTPGRCRPSLLRDYNARDSERFRCSSRRKKKHFLDASDPELEMRMKSPRSNSLRIS